MNKLCKVAVPPLTSDTGYQIVSGLVETALSMGLQPITLKRRLSGRLYRRLPINSWHPSACDSLILLPILGLQADLAFQASFNGPIVLYCWDAWECSWDSWEHYLRRIQPVLTCISSRQSARHLANRLPNLNILYMPEAIIVSKFRNVKLLIERTHKVLELGRRYDHWHSAVVDVLHENRVEHLYQREGSLVFSTESELIEGLADSAISVCFPSSLTHPRRSGKVETMTARYLESMASGCLIVGQAPQELIDLMGRNPLVEIDWNSPENQILSILNDLETWQDLVDRNLHWVMTHGDWSTRIQDINDAI